MNQKQLISFFFLVGLLISIVFANRWQPNQVMSQNPTVPTPTPVGQPTNTPAPPPPATNTPNSGGGGNTPVPANTATHTPVPVTPTNTSTPLPTPDGGFIPTAVPCATNPTATAANRANVRSAPNTQANIIYTFVVGETRRVIGRSDRVDWWVVALPDGTQGWVANIAVTINGYTGYLPIFPTTGNAQTPEPTSSWNPTPNPICTDVPTLTPTSTATPTASPTPTVTPITQTITATATMTNSEGVATPTTTLEPEPLPNSSAVTDTGNSNNGREGYPAPTALSQGEGYPAITPTLIMPLSDTPEPIGYIPANPTSVPLDDGSEESGGLPNFIPIIGLLLIAGGVFAYMMNRRQK